MRMWEHRELSTYWKLMKFIANDRWDWFFTVSMCMNVFRKLYSKAIDKKINNLDIKILDNKKMVKITDWIVDINWEKYICIEEYFGWL